MENKRGRYCFFISWIYYIYWKRKPMAHVLLLWHVDHFHFLTSICWVNTVFGNVWYSQVFVNTMSSNSNWKIVYYYFFLYFQKKVCMWKLHCEGGAVFSSPCLSSFPHHLYVATLGGLFLAINPVCTCAYMSFILISSLNETKCISEIKIAILMKGKKIIRYHEIFFTYGIIMIYKVAIILTILHKSVWW